MKRIGVLLVVGCVCFALLGGCGSSAGRPVRPVTDGFSCRIEAAYGDMTVAGTLTRPGGNALDNANFQPLRVFAHGVAVNFRRLPGQIPFVGGNPINGTQEPPGLSRPHIDLHVVPDGDGLHHALQIMVAVRPLSKNVQR